MPSKEEKLTEVRGKVGLGDHRPLTTGDLDSISEYVKEANKSTSSSSSSKSKSAKTRSKSK